MPPTAAEELLSNQVSKLETRFENHALKMEERLDQIVEIMQKVTQLQERDRHQAQDITRLEQTVATVTLSNNEVIKALFKKSEDATKAMSDHEKEDVKAHDQIYTEIRANKAVVDGLVNRGQGAWKVIGIVFVAIQAVGGFFVYELYDAHKMDQEVREAQERRIIDLEYQSKRIAEENQRDHPVKGSAQ